MQKKTTGKTWKSKYSQCICQNHKCKITFFQVKKELEQEKAIVIATKKDLNLEKENKEAVNSSFLKLFFEKCF